MPMGSKDQTALKKAEKSCTESGANATVTGDMLTTVREAPLLRTWICLKKWEEQSNKNHSAEAGCDIFVEDN